MSDFKFDCPHCDQSLEVPEDLLGEDVDCPTCRGRIQLPAPREKEKSRPQKRNYTYTEKSQQSESVGNQMVPPTNAGRPWGCLLAIGLLVFSLGATYVWLAEESAPHLWIVKWSTVRNLQDKANQCAEGKRELADFYMVNSKHLDCVRDLYQQAASEGDTIATCTLGMCYKDGIGGEKDIEKAIAMFAKCADQSMTAKIEYTKLVGPSQEELPTTLKAIELLESRLAFYDTDNNYKIHELFETDTSLKWLMKERSGFESAVTPPWIEPKLQLVCDCIVFSASAGDELQFDDTMREGDFIQRVKERGKRHEKERQRLISLNCVNGVEAKAILAQVKKQFFDLPKTPQGRDYQARGK